MDKELTCRVARLEGERIDEEMEEDDVTLGATIALVSICVLERAILNYARRISTGGGRPSVCTDEGSVDVVEQVSPDLTDVCYGAVRKRRSRQRGCYSL